MFDRCTPDSVTELKQRRDSVRLLFLITFCGFVSGCEALALSGRAACTKPLLYAGASYLVKTLN